MKNSKALHLAGRLFLVLTLVFAAPLAPYAQTSPNPTLLPLPFSPETAPYFTALKDIKAGDAPVRVLRDAWNIHIDTEGRRTTTIYQVYQILNKNRASSWEYVSIAWSPWNEERPTIEARVINPDGTIRLLDPSTILDTGVTNDDDKVLSDRRILKVPLPGIIDNAVVEWRCIRKESKPTFSSGVSGSYNFGNSVPVGSTFISISFPQSASFSWRTEALGNIKPTESVLGGMKTLAWEQPFSEGLAQLPSNLPPDASRYPVLFYTTAPSWAKVAQNYAAQIEPILSEANLSSLARSIIKDASTPRLKAEAIMAWMAKEIRYTGIEFGESAYIPHSPSDVLARRFGDCKDQATLMTGLLRAAGIQADIALLRTGPGFDTPTDMPGLGWFDHAIVCADLGGKVWIDPTNPYLSLGQRPLTNQGRRVLIASKATTTLATIPNDNAAANALVHDRVIKLRDLGPAILSEDTYPQGALEASYRRFYSERTPGEIKNYNESYGSENFNANPATNTIKSSNSPSRNLQEPFSRKLSWDKAPIGYTDLDNASVWFMTGRIFDRLPEELISNDYQDRTRDYFLLEPFRTVWNYQIIPPPAMVVSELPPPRNIALGPGRFTSSFTADESGTIKGQVSFELDTQVLSPQDISELRAGIVELLNAEALVLRYEPETAVLLREGRASDAFALHESLIKAYPDQAVYRMRKAQTLLNLGLGAEARKASLEATAIDPMNKEGWNLHGFILRHDTIGRDYHRGAEFQGAALAYKAASAMDSSDPFPKGNLAIIYEYNNAGLRYGPGAALDQAIELYRAMTADERSKLGISDNLAMALFYNKDFQGVITECATMKNPPLSALAAAIALKNGVPAAIAQINRSIAKPADRQPVFQSAGSMALFIGAYDAAALLFTAAATGPSAQQIKSWANMVREMPRVPEIRKGAAQPVLNLMDMLSYAILNPDLKEFPRYVSQELLEEQPYSNSEQTEAERFVISALGHVENQGTPPLVLHDMFFASNDFKVDEAGPALWRVSLRNRYDNTALSFFMAGNTKVPLVIGATNDPGPAALYLLHNFSKYDSKTLQNFLGWISEQDGENSSKDPLDSSNLAIYQASAKAESNSEIRTALHLLALTRRNGAKEAIPFLEQQSLLEKLPQRQAAIYRGLTEALFNLGEFARTQPWVDKLLGLYPESELASKLLVASLISQGKTKELDTWIAQAKKSNLFPASIHNAEHQALLAQGDYQGAYGALQKRVANGSKNQEDFNSLAWLSLFTGTMGNDDINTGIKAYQLMKDNPGVIHTLACQLVEVAQFDDAVHLLQQAMTIEGELLPSASYRYILGRIAQLAGLDDVAQKFYQSIPKPAMPLMREESTWALANQRMKE